MTFQQIIILGAGAVGSAYGALLSQRGQVKLIGRSKHVSAINKNGLKIEGDYGGTYKVKALTTIDDIPARTLLIATMKAYDVGDSLRATRSLIRNDTTILLLQNGLGIEEIANTSLNGQGKIVRGLTNLAAERLANGRIRLWKGETILASTPVSPAIAQLFKKAKLPTRVSNNIQRELWKKLVMNCVINPLTAILKVHNNQINSPLLKPIRYAIMNECLAVAKAEGVHLEMNLMASIDQTLSYYTNRSSMLQDILQGKQTEISFINGKVVNLGKHHTIPTPINECLSQLVKFQEGQRK